MEKTHASHIGIEGCICQARDSLYWPRMTTEIKEYISKCDVCMTHRTGQGKEPMLQHEFVTWPWARVAADLCEFDDRVLLVVSDYYSNFIEVARLSNLTSHAVIKELKAIFARYGVPDTLVTDNGSQFSSAEFAVFAKTWMFEHKTSSPTYPQSNGKAEKAVQTVKTLFRKCKASGTSEFQALLDWRNTPTAGIGTSPAQRLMGRCCKTLLPIAGSLLQPNFPTEEDTRKLLGTKQQQQFYYNKKASPLEPISVGDAVRVRLPGEKTWSPGTCTASTGQRSFRVQVGNAVYRRIRRQLIKTGESNEATLPEDMADPENLTPRSVGADGIAPPEECPPSVPRETTKSQRPQRHTRPPGWLKDFVTS